MRCGNALLNYQIHGLNLNTVSTESQSMRTSILNLRIFLGYTWIASTACGVIGLCLSGTSLGESTNKRMILPGSRAQALGGAFTAIADDSSAGWYNPAGLGFLRGPGVSASVTNFSISKKSVAEVVSSQDLSENSAAIYPGFAGANTNMGPFSLAWSYFTLEQQNTDESQSITAEAGELSNAQLRQQLATSTFDYERTELTSSNLIHTGVSLAVSLGKKVSLGVSEFYYRRLKQTSLKERSIYNSGVFYDSFSRLSTKNEGTLTVAGLLIRGPELSIGISARIPKALSDQTTLATSYIIHTGAAPELSSDSLATHREDELTVRTWNLGIAWTPTESLVLSADAIYHAPTKTPWKNSGGFDTRAVTDWSFGGELRTSSLLFAGGVFSNSSLVARPKAVLGGAEPAQINYTGFSASFGLRNGRSESLFIMVRQRGLGLKQMAPGHPTLNDVTIDTQTFSLATSYKI